MISFKTKNKDLGLYINLNRLFLYLYNRRHSFIEYIQFKLSLDDFIKRTEVIIKCVFIAWFIKKRTKYL